ncbi:hypothetical protein ACJRPK_15355 [Aquimarina sp. 2-A2]|uniref:hypothetical protein n=1 Tax=Aquimarina sp. 2-A2 TaxID=3382644 RepID=UPI00387F011D
MKKVYSFWTICVVTIMITYGNIPNNEFTQNSNICNDSLFQFNEHRHDANLKYEFVNHIKFKKIVYFVSIELRISESSISTLLNSKIKKELDKIKAQDDHLNNLLTKKRSQYQLYKVALFGQATNPVNIATNPHKLQPPRIEGVGLRLRF